MSWKLILAEARQARPRVSGELRLPPVVLGCATFGYGIYQDKTNIVSDLPVRVVRLALRSGITAFDTCEFADGCAHDIEGADD